MRKRRVTYSREFKLSILNELLTKKAVEAGLTAEERKKFNNFLQEMKKLRVIRSGEP